MEQLAAEAINSKNNQYHSQQSPQKNRILFNLSNYGVVQKSLIHALLTRYNCVIEDLAHILSVDAKKLFQVWQGKEQLTKKKSCELISLFYALSS